MNIICQFLRRCIYVFLGYTDRFLNIKYPLVTVLCYHSIADDWHHSVRLSEFKKQMIYLKTKFDFIDIKTLEQFLNNKIKLLKPSILLTFDDGYRDILKVSSFLKNEGIRPTIFLIGDPKKVDRVQLNNRKRLLTMNDVKKLQSIKFDFGFHTNSHPDLLKILRKELNSEITKPKPLEYFAIPKGRYNREVINLVKSQGYRLCFTMNDGQISQKSDRFTLPRIGINLTHSFAEFKHIMSPSNVLLRRVIKKYLIKL